MGDIFVSKSSYFLLLSLAIMFRLSIYKILIVTASNLSKGRFTDTGKSWDDYRNKFHVFVSESSIFYFIMKEILFDT